MGDALAVAYNRSSRNSRRSRDLIIFSCVICCSFQYFICYCPLGF
jgi:hypothetical protein